MTKAAWRTRASSNTHLPRSTGSRLCFEVRIVGKAANPRFLETIRDLAETHDPSIALDTVRAYHWGPRFLVEVEIVMDERTLLRESHDCGVLLQHKIEAVIAG